MLCHNNKTSTQAQRAFCHRPKDRKVIPITTPTQPSEDAKRRGLKRRQIEIMQEKKQIEQDWYGMEGEI